MDKSLQIERILKCVTSIGQTCLYILAVCWKFMLFIQGVVGSGEGFVYFTSPGRSADIGLQLGKACYPCSR